MREERSPNFQNENLIYFFSSLSALYCLKFGLDLEEAQQLRSSLVLAGRLKLTHSVTDQAYLESSLRSLEQERVNGSALLEILAAIAANKINYRPGSSNLESLNHPPSPSDFAFELERASLPTLVASLKNQETNNDPPDFISLVKVNTAASRCSQQQRIVPHQEAKVSQVLATIFNPIVKRLAWGKLGNLNPEACRQAGEDPLTPSLQKRFLARLVAKNSFSPKREQASSLTDELSYLLHQPPETFAALVRIQSFSLRLQNWHQQPYQT